MPYGNRLKLIVRIIKARFNNLTAEELIGLATAILDALEEEDASNALRQS